MKYLTAIVLFALGVLLGSASSVDAHQPCPTAIRPTATATRVPCATCPPGKYCAEMCKRPVAPGQMLPTLSIKK